MNLVNENIFLIENLQQHEGQITADLTLVKDHPILLGHFPSQPVVPGACMVELIKTVVENVLDLTLQLKSAGNIKFMQMITPDDAEELKLVVSYKPIESGLISLTGSIIKAETACFKLQAVFTLV